MTFIDTHTHLYLKEFDADRDQTIQDAIQKGVEKFFLPNIDAQTLESLEKMARDYPKVCYPMIGIHPTSVKKKWEDQIEEIQQHYKKDFHIAIGEIGIDLYWDKSLKKEQMHAFRKQIHWAKNKKLPIVIHCRDAFDEIFEIVDQENDTNLTGVFHCFTGTEEQATHIINYGGFKLGIGGVVTFKNGGLDQSLKNVDLKHIVLETDAPYLAPAPFRGKRNQSGYIPLIAKKLSDIYGVSEEYIGEVTTQNALSIFKI